MKNKLIWVLSAFLMIGSCVLLLGTAHARFQKTATEDVEFQVRKPATFEIVKMTGWTTEEDGGQRFQFYIDNSNNELDSYFTIRLASTIGLELDGAQVVLIVKNTSGIEREYIGEAKPFAEESEYYKQMGEGNEYVFTDNTNEELVWSLPGTASDAGSFEAEYVIELQGAKQANTMEIIISEAQMPVE